MHYLHYCLCFINLSFIAICIARWFVALPLKNIMVCFPFVDSIVTIDATSLKPKIVNTVESMRSTTLDESDAEWEGFEAVSSNSESEEVCS